MKTVNKLVLSLSLLVAPLAFAATLPGTAYSESNRGSAKVPTPLVVISPDVDAGTAFPTMKLDFIVDETEEVSVVMASESADADFLASLAPTIALRPSAPVLSEGKPVVVKVDLPLIVAVKIETVSRFVVN